MKSALGEIVLSPCWITRSHSKQWKICFVARLGPHPIFLLISSRAQRQQKSRIYRSTNGTGHVLCNGGLHVHALMPPASRLKESLADHFREKRDLYAGSGRPALRIDVRPVVEDHRRVVDYVLKTVLNGRLNDDAVLVLPRSRG